ncbi:hypothetical protein HQN89_32660 [Paenibacillus frigoriresistens]|uniref:hypothetical protein n=1 Tax=Paenibacillus alginolyticus TaxID=59839 RepID=UPI0015674FC6|nr:hypothetical protein [Paenibacillus frigoriresistens]NRF95591.1 hypothetical protein [Paenibacillus frigoriresistens]
MARKIMFRFFDELAWKSEELEKKNFPQYVFEDMRKALQQHESQTEVSRTKINYLIDDSCHIQCSDDIHQGQFHSLASHTYPIVFNNTCTSWKEFALHMIAGGCRAYIGTLWKVGNQIAVNSASQFYKSVFDTTIINSVNVMLNAIEEEQYQDIYIFCGLHFSTVKRHNIISNEKVVEELINSLKGWINYVNDVKSTELLISVLKNIEFLNKALTPFFQMPSVINILVVSAVVIKQIEEKKNM